MSDQPAPHRARPAPARHDADRLSSLAETAAVWLLPVVFLGVVALFVLA